MSRLQAVDVNGHHGNINLFFYSLKLISNINGEVTLKNGQGHSVVITAEPLKFEFLDKNGDVAVVVNENSQLLVEPLKEKGKKAVGNDDEGSLAVDTVSVIF